MVPTQSQQVVRHLLGTVGYRAIRNMRSLDWRMLRNACAGIRIASSWLDIVRSLMRRSVLLLAAASLPLGAALAQPTNARTRVVVQVSEADPARWNLALNNVRNLQDGMGADKVVIEIVAYGPGVGMLKADAVTNERIGELVHRGIAVNACQNTMRSLKLERTDMHPDVGYVPAGVVEIVKRQQEGWAYVRP